MRWNIPVIGKDMLWLAWSDCKNPRADWHSSDLSQYAKPTGVLLYDGHSGTRIELQADQDFDRFPQTCYTIGDFLATESNNHGSSRFRCRLFDPVRGTQSAWPEEMTDRLLEHKRIRVSNDPQKRMIVYDSFPGCMPCLLGNYELFEQTDKSITLKSKPTVSDRFRLTDWDRPIALAGNQLVFVSSGDFGPEWIKKLEKNYPQLISWRLKIIDPVWSTVIILNAENGSLLHSFPSHQDAEYLNSSNQLYLFQTLPDLRTSSEQILALEAWQFPLSLWSPWWGRFSGIIVFLLLLCGLRKRTSSLHACN
ncbi:MAG: hypothetical protein QM703_14890 [Gemmatales bacterium]